MAQIQAGVTYATGAQVTATNLNAHVNNAVLVPGAISDQTAASSSTSADSVLLLQGGVLKKATLAQIQGSIVPDAANYIQKNGSVAMTGELTLSSSTPVNALSAASKGYVDTGLATKQASLGFTPVNKAGDTGVGPIALSANPVSALQVTTKQYVDAADALKANLAGATFTGAVTLAADPASALQASTKQYVDAQITSSIPAGAVMAFYRNTPPTGWLECNGQSVAAYPNLVALGITNAPDLRGEFVRGWDNTRGVDPSRVLGSAQTDAFQGHAHSLNDVFGYPNSSQGGRADVTQSTLNTKTGSAVSDGVNGSPRTASETRPRNIALMYCIKT